MPKTKSKKRRAFVHPSTKKRRLPDPAIKEIEDTVLVMHMQKGSHDDCPCTSASFRTRGLLKPIVCRQRARMELR
jgi:hypothetical protein